MSRTMSLERRTALTGIGFVTPTVLIIALILIYPIIQSVVLSFGQSSIDGSQPYQFVGLKHYAALMGDGRFWNALGVTFTFTALSIPLELALGIGLALLMNESFKGKGWRASPCCFPGPCRQRSTR